MLPGTNVQVISFDDEYTRIYYYLALLNSKLLRVFFHVYFQNKIKYTFKIQDYHVKFYPIRFSNAEWLLASLAKILVDYSFDPKLREKLTILDDLLDFLVIELYLGEFLKSNLTTKVISALKEYDIMKLKLIDSISLTELILKIEENQDIKEEINKIKKNLILDEKELEIKLLKVGCSLE